MENRNKNIKIIILFFFTNICTFMLFSIPEVSEPIESVQQVARPDYIQLKIRAILKTNLSLKTPHVLTTENRNLYIPYVFILEKETSNSQLIDIETTKSENEYLISVHKKYLKNILNTKLFTILPQLPKEVVMNNNPNRRSIYEITL